MAGREDSNPFVGIEPTRYLDQEGFEPSTPVAQAYRTAPRRVRKRTVALVESLPGTASPLFSAFHGASGSTRRRNRTYAQPRPRGIEPSAPTT